MFSIPMDGPMSFSTPHVSLQWILRFEFETTSKHVDWTKYEHPLLIEEREEGEWGLPITVQAPISRTHVTFTRKERLFSPNGFWVGQLEETKHIHLFFPDGKHQMEEAPQTTRVKVLASGNAIERQRRDVAAGR